MKRNQGITLIALVITIVVLIILASVAINMTIGENGIFTRAVEAKRQQEIANIKEKLELEKANIVLDGKHTLTLTNYLEQLKKVGYIDDEDIQEGENENTKLVIVDNYIFSITDDGNGNITVECEGEAGKLLPKITGIAVTKTTTNSIAVKVTAKRVNGGDYKYYIKNVETGEEYSLKETSKLETYTFTGLLQNKEYKIKVEVTNANGTVEKETEGTIKTVTVQDLSQADIEFKYEPNGWHNGTVTATASLKAGITLPEGTSLQTSKDADDWDDTPSQDFTENGYIYVRIWDGNNGGSYAAGEVSKIDTTAPQVTGATPTTNSVSITATDEASGIKGYAVTENDVEPTSFTELTTSTLNFSEEVGSLTQGKTYFVWVKDEAGNVSESKDVTIKKQLVTEITLNKTTAEIAPGETLTLSVENIKPTDAFDKSVTWSSADETVATVSDSGVVTAVASGTTTISVAANDGSQVSASCTVTVKQLVTGITLNKTSATIYVGDTLTLSATVNPSNASEKGVTWSSSSTSVATVSDSGVVTAKAAGSTTIKATAKDGSEVYGSCTVTVKQLVTEITLNKTNETTYVGETLTLSATVNPSNASEKGVTWSSSSTSVATVSDSGVVTAKAAGSTTIKATAKDGSEVYGSCTVTVKPLVEALSSYTPSNTPLTYGWGKLKELAEIISNNPSIVKNTTAGVNLRVNGTTYTLGVGDKMTTTYDGANKDVRILGFNHDTLASSSKTAGISFEFVDILYDAQMNTSNDNTAGWGEMPIRTNLNSTELNKLGNKTYIKQVKKTYLKGDCSTQTTTSNDSLWILSCSEIWGNKANATGLEGLQYKYYAGIVGEFTSGDNDLRKYCNGVLGAWWLRSPNSSNKYGTCTVNWDGSGVTDYSSNSHGVVPGFAI